MKQAAYWVLAGLLFQGCYTPKNGATTKDLESGIGLNEFCDPLGSMYPGGTPLFNVDTGVTMSLEEYLTLKGLNIYCDPIGTAYFGGTPLFDESTGMTITLQEYLANKPWVRNPF